MGHGAKPMMDHGAKPMMDHGAKPMMDHGAKPMMDHGNDSNHSTINNLLFILARRCATKLLNL
jgi:hypothetical protein